MGDLRVGLVGAGWIAREHVETLERLGGAQIVAICDVDPERAKAVTDAATSAWA
jgi:UDP-N-acetyl-2-amino-2-deoxyglucuronate dehydrogenase